MLVIIATSSLKIVAFSSYLHMPCQVGCRLGVFWCFHQIFIYYVDFLVLLSWLTVFQVDVAISKWFQCKAKSIYLEIYRQHATELPESEQSNADNIDHKYQDIRHMGHTMTRSQRSMLAIFDLYNQMHLLNFIIASFNLKTQPREYDVQSPLLNHIHSSYANFASEHSPKCILMTHQS